MPSTWCMRSAWRSARRDSSKRAGATTRQRVVANGARSSRSTRTAIGCAAGAGGGFREPGRIHRGPVPGLEPVPVLAAPRDGPLDLRVQPPEERRRTEPARLSVSHEGVENHHRDRPGRRREAAASGTHARAATRRRDPRPQSARELDALAARIGGEVSAQKTATTPVPRLALSIEEACAALGVGWDFFNEHISPELRLVRRGRRKLVAVRELERWLAENGERVLEPR